MVLIASLTLDAIVINRNNDLESVPGSLYFFIGSIAIFGGGLFEWIIWLANPLSLYSIIYLTKDNRKALKTAPTALVIAISFRFWKEILGSESGAMAQIISFKYGYYLWILSIVILNCGIIFYFHKYRNKIPMP